MAEMNRELDKDLKEEHSANDHDDGSSNDSETESDSTDSSDSDSDYECTICKKKFSGAVPLRQHQKGSKHKKALAKKKKERKLMDKDHDGEEDEEDQDQIIPVPYQTCKVCDKEFSGVEPYGMHLKSKVHKQKVLQASILEKVKGGEINVDKLRDLYLSKKAAAGKSSDVVDNPDEDEHDGEEFECKDCDKTFSGLIPFGQHLASKTHARQVDKKGLLGKITSENVKDLKNDVSTLTMEDDILVCKICSASFCGPENAVAHLKSRKHAKSLDKYLRKLEKKKKKVAKLVESDSDSAGSEDKRALEGTDELDDNVPEKAED